jgi:hypothetical protein
MSNPEAIEQLTSDLHWQIDQMGPRGIKTEAGRPYTPSHFKRGLASAVDDGGPALVEYVRGHLYKTPTAGYRKLEAADSLDLACEWLVADAAATYADLFSEADRAVARERLAPHIAATETRQAEKRARIDAARARIREDGVPARSELDASLRSRHHGAAAGARGAT